MPHRSRSKMELDNSEPSALEEIYYHTMGLCSFCKRKVQARVIAKNGQVLIKKYCSEHGVSYGLVSSDLDWFEKSVDYVKPQQLPLTRKVDDFKGCPDSCGLCPQHEQHTCMPVIEITNVCNMECPICLKNPLGRFDMSTDEFKCILRDLERYEGTVPVVNLSGGEPTLNPNLIEILNAAKASSVLQTTISTNGLKLLGDQNLRRVLKDTDTLVALQFDGFRDETYKHLRGRPLTAQKMTLIETMEREGLKYSLVATIMEGVNADEVADITDFFFQSKAISLMFQPACFTGRANQFNANHFAEPYRRSTIPDIIEQAANSKWVKREDFNPLPCSHHTCFALAYFLKTDEMSYVSVKDFLGEESFLNMIANRTLPGLDYESFKMIKNKVFELWSASDCCDEEQRILLRIRGIMDELNKTRFSSLGCLEAGERSLKAIFIHQFMDVDNFDFSRLVKCCTHYPQTDGRLIPMCAYNVFDMARSL